MDVQFPWEETPTQFHRAKLEIPMLYVDKVRITLYEIGDIITISLYGVL